MSHRITEFTDNVDITLQLVHKILTRNCFVLDGPALLDGRTKGHRVKEIDKYFLEKNKYC